MPTKIDFGPSAILETAGCIAFKLGKIIYSIRLINLLQQCFVSHISYAAGDQVVHPFIESLIPWMMTLMIIRSFYDVKTHCQGFTGKNDCTLTAIYDNSSIHTNKKKPTLWQAVIKNAQQLCAWPICKGANPKCQIIVIHLPLGPKLPWKYY